MEVFTTMTETWDEYEWPDWVPQVIKDQIIGFWDKSQGRGPAGWEQDAKTEQDKGLEPELGTLVRIKTTNRDGFQGRWIHAWNNMGRVCVDEQYRVASNVEVEVITQPLNPEKILLDAQRDGIKVIEEKSAREGHDEIEGLTGEERRKWTPVDYYKDESGEHLVIGGFGKERVNPRPTPHHSPTTDKAGPIPGRWTKVAYFEDEDSERVIQAWVDSDLLALIRSYLGRKEGP